MATRSCSTAPTTRLERRRSRPRSTTSGRTSPGARAGPAATHAGPRLDGRQGRRRDHRGPRRGGGAPGRAYHRDPGRPATAPSRRPSSPVAGAAIRPDAAVTVSRRPGSGARPGARGRGRPGRRRGIALPGGRGAATLARRPTAARPGGARRNERTASARRESGRGSFAGASGRSSWASSTSRRTRSPATGSWRRAAPKAASRRPSRRRGHGRRGRGPARHRRRIDAARATRPVTSTRSCDGSCRSSRAVRGALPSMPLSIDTTKPAVAAAALDAGAERDQRHLGRRRGRCAVRVLPRSAACPSSSCTTAPSRATATSCPRSWPTSSARSTVRSRRASRGPTSSSTRASASARRPTRTSRCSATCGACERSGRPILLGTSRKSTLGKVLDLPADERLEATLATTVLGIAAGVDIVRVHDVRANVRAARMADAIVRGHAGTSRRMTDRIVLADMAFQGAPRRQRLGEGRAAALRGRRRAGARRPAGGRRRRPGEDGRLRRASTRSRGRSSSRRRSTSSRRWPRRSPTRSSPSTPGAARSSSGSESPRSGSAARSTYAGVEIRRARAA